MVTHTTFFQRLIEALGIHKIHTYTEDVGKEQTRILNEFSAVGDALLSVYQEITGKRFREKHKIHVLRDVLRYFSTIRRPLQRLEDIATKAASTEDDNKRKALKIKARQESDKMSKYMKDVYAHLLDLRHPNTNLSGYNAVFDMWRSIEKRLNASTIKSVLGSNNSIDLFEKEIDVLNDDLKEYNVDEQELLELDRAFLTMIVTLRKHFSRLMDEYNAMISASIQKETAKQFVSDLHYIRHFVDRLRFQEERLFVKEDKFMNTFEKRHKQITMYLIESLEHDLKNLLQELSAFVNDHIGIEVKQEA
jgi:hypothetical protein